MPYISVIVPVYNSEKTVGRCVNSIINQTYRDIEVILVDDGSKDESGRLCDELAELDPRIHVLHKENQGVSAARNSGVELAEGEYIQFIDSDDHIPDFYLESLVKAQKEYGEDTFCWTILKIVSENHAVAEAEFRYEEERISVASRKDVLKFSARYLLNSPVNKLYRREVIQSGQLKMDESIAIAEDLLFNLQYMDAAGDCRVVILNEVPYFYMRSGEASLDHGYRKGYYQTHKKVLEQLLTYCDAWQVPREDQTLYDTRYWEYMQSALYNNTLADSGLTFWKKAREDGRVLKDERFQTCLEQRKDSMSRGTYLSYRSRSGLLAALYGKIRG